MFLLQEYAGAFSSVQTGVFRVSDGGAAASAHNDTMPLDAAGLSRLLSRWLSSWRAHTPRRTAGARPVKLGQSLCALLQDGPARLPVMNAFQGNRKPTPRPKNAPYTKPYCKRHTQRFPSQSSTLR